MPNNPTNYTNLLPNSSKKVQRSIKISNDDLHDFRELNKGWKMESINSQHEETSLWSTWSNEI